MANTDSPSEALDKIMKQTRQILKETVYEFHSALQRVAPVDTGHFKLSWKVKPVSKDEYLISNNAPYASILWAGRMMVNGKMYGSEQWSKGGDIMLAKRNIQMQNKLKIIRE